MLVELAWPLISLVYLSYESTTSKPFITFQLPYVASTAAGCSASQTSHKAGPRRSSSSATATDHAGQPLDLEDLAPDAMLNAIIASFDGDQAAPVEVITGLIT